MQLRETKCKARHLQMFSINHVPLTQSSSSSQIRLRKHISSAFRNGDDIIGTYIIFQSAHAQLKQSYCFP